MKLFNNIKKYEDKNIFKFVTLNEISFTTDLYNELKMQIGESDEPYENLIAICN